MEISIMIDNWRSPSRKFRRGLCCGQVSTGVVCGRSSDQDSWIEKTKLVSRWREIKRSVEEHKWYESEKAGRDIGWNRAFTDWLIHGPQDEKRDEHDGH